MSDFSILQRISSGAYGSVYIAKRKRKRRQMQAQEQAVQIGALDEEKMTEGQEDPRMYAIKVMAKSDILRKNQVAAVFAERSVMAALYNSDFVVKLHHSFQSENHLYFVMDFIPGGDLYSLLQNLGVLEEEVQYIYSGCLQIRCSCRYIFVIY